MAYKFQSGDATLSGSVTLVTYQDLLFETDAASNIGTAAKAVGITYSDRLTASVAVSASAVYADNFYGNGSGITGITADGVDTATSTGDATRYVPFVDQATGADGESLLIHSALALNPSTGVVTIAGSAAGITIGSAVMVEADFEKLDDITNGTATASKAVVLDASKNITGLNEVSGASLALSGLTKGRVPTVGPAGLLEDHGDFQYNGTQLYVYSSGGPGNMSIATVTGSIAVLNAAQSGVNAMLGNDGQVSGSSHFSTAGNINVQGSVLAASNSTFAKNVSIQNGVDVSGAQSNFSAAVSITGSSDVGLNVSSIYDGGASILSIGNILAGHTGGGTHTAHLNSNGEISGSSLKIADGMIIGDAILPREDGAADLGSSAKEWKIIYGQRLTASVAMSASAVYADNYYGNGSSLSGISADNIDVDAGSVSAVSPIIFSAAGSVGASGVQPLGLATFGFNPATGKFQVPGVISGSGALQGASLDVGGGQVAGTTLSIVGAAVAATLSGSGLVSGGSANFAAVCTAGDLNDGSGGSLSGGVLTGSSITMDTTIMAAANKFQVADDGDVTAVAGTFSGNISGSDAVQAGSLSIGGGVMSVSTAGNISLGSAIFSASYGSNLTASRAEFAPFGTSANRSLSIDSGGLAMLDSSGDDSFEVTYAGVVSGSNALKGLSLALHGASIASDGDLAAVAGTFTGAISGSSTLSVAGNVQLDGADDGVAFVVADSMYFRDAGSGLMRRDTWADVMSATAGDGITATAGVLSVSSAQTIDVDTVGNASRQLTAAGMNYATASITTNVTYTLPASPSTGDLVYIKLAGLTSGKHVVISGSAMQMIDGTSTITASSGYAGISLCYVASDIWRIF